MHFIIFLSNTFFLDHSEDCHYVIEYDKRLSLFNMVDGKFIWMIESTLGEFIILLPSM